MCYLICYPIRVPEMIYDQLPETLYHFCEVQYRDVNEISLLIESAFQDQ